MFRSVFIAFEIRDSLFKIRYSISRVHIDDLKTKEMVNNPGCVVEEREDGVLYCTTTGRGVTIVLFITGMLFIYGSIVIIGWDLPRGRMHSSSLFWGALVFCVGILFQWRCLRRQREMGTFEIDKKNSQFQKIGAGKSLGFEEVSHLRLAVNPLGIFVPGLILRLPFWLFIHFNNGPQYRIAMGKKQSIQHMLDWFQDAGISINNRQSMNEGDTKREKQAPFD